MNSTNFPAEEVAAYINVYAPPQFTRRLIAGCFPCGQLGNSPSSISQSLLAGRQSEGARFGARYRFAFGRDYIIGRRPHGGLSELPEAYAENNIGLGR